MAYVARPTDFSAPVPLARPPAGAFPGQASPAETAKKQETPARRSLLRRIYDKLMENRQISANRDIEIFLARRGHRLTDSIERDLNDHLFNGEWRSRR